MMISRNQNAAQIVGRARQSRRESVETGNMSRAEASLAAHSVVAYRPGVGLGQAFSAYLN